MPPTPWMPNTPGLDHADVILAVGLERFLLHHQQVGDQAGHILGGEQGLALAAGLDLVHPGVPHHGGIHAAGQESGGGIPCAKVHHLHVLQAHAVLVQRQRKQEVGDTELLERNLLALEIGHALDLWAHHEGVVAGGVVVDQDGLECDAFGERRHGVAPGLRVAVDPAG